MGVNTHISYEQEQNRRDAVLEHRAMVRRVRTLTGKRTYTTEQCYNQICRRFEKEKQYIKLVSCLYNIEKPAPDCMNA